MTSTLDISVDDPGSYAFDRLYQKNARSIQRRSNF